MTVLALIGAAGTGKSHKASVIANELDADIIIDDGLVIKDSRILAGKSAKREPTRAAAVRRAIFLDPEHRTEVRLRISELSPRTVLVLGTSANMVNRITDALGLPRPERYIRIEEIASPKEIRRARRVRQEQGKHVIPAPTFEVRKSFSGYLVDPLRFFLKAKNKPQAPMIVEKSVVRPTFSSLGRFTISETVVASIATRACRTTQGVRGVKKVNVQSAPEGVIINLDVALGYGVAIQDVLRAAQARVRQAVEHMTALNVLAVNLVARKLILDDRGRLPGAAEDPRSGR